MNYGEQRTILIIDDEVDHSEYIAEIMPPNIRTLIAANGEEGLRLARQELPDVILLDINMPKTDGITLCGELRNNEATRDIPIMMLTAAYDSESRTNAFNQGADDYLVKPMKAKELIARVFSKIRRLNERENRPHIVTCGNMILDSTKFDLTIKDASIPISVLEFNILKYFVHNRDRVISRPQLLQAIWRDSVVSSRTVDTHMVSLRKKLSVSDHELRTVYGAGYILSKKLDQELMSDMNSMPLNPSTEAPQLCPTT